MPTDFADSIYNMRNTQYAPAVLLSKTKQRGISYGQFASKTGILVVLRRFLGIIHNELRIVRKG